MTNEDLQKAADELRRTWVTNATRDALERDPTTQELNSMARPPFEHAFIAGARFGYEKALDLVAARIKASVNLDGIPNPSIALVNCALQAKHDFELALKLKEKK